ncbi:MAG: TIGR04283 family arsenosugar biosynthesis glycosyltransferase [Proteobacteria bacterium]|nr:TIGR04283 family arsenosugar biosynthesis glycosyltransferase [Pseudomonadota bacterium]
MPSIVIPTLNAGESLARLLPCLAGHAGEIIVSDGGSTDDTCAIALSHGAVLVEGSAGRGPQLARGAAAAGGGWLLFLHADLVPGEGWDDAMRAHIAEPGGPDRAAAFRFALDDPAPQARRVERLANWRARRLALPYGDQGLLISRILYDRIGGYRPLPLMEDVDIARRLGRRRLVLLDAALVSSARRYRRDGWWARPARNLLCLSLYLAGVPATALRRLYG